MTAPDPCHWFCRVGEVPHESLPAGSDMPMRGAVCSAYKELTGFEPEYIFSGWGDQLPEPYRAVAEDRLPDDSITLDELIRDNWQLSDPESVAIILRRLPDEAWKMLVDLIDYERKS